MVMYDKERDESEDKGLLVSMLLDPKLLHKHGLNSKGGIIHEPGEPATDPMTLGVAGQERHASGELGPYTSSIDLLRVALAEMDASGDELHEPQTDDLLQLPSGRLSVTSMNLSRLTGQYTNVDSHLSRMNRMLAHHLQQGDVGWLLDELEQKAGQEFMQFKEAIKPHNSDQTQFDIAQSLNDIEERIEDYPLLTPKQAAVLMGEMNSKNPSRVINTAREQGNILVFYFGDSKTAQIPAFQFKPGAQGFGSWEVMPKLINILKGVHDWGVYSWFTTENEDLGCTPADAIGDPGRTSDLLYLAGLLKSESTLRDLNYVRAGEGKE